MKRWTPVLLMWMSWSLAQVAGAKVPYTYVRLGSPTDATGINLPGGTVLMDGSTDVDAAFQWMCRRSKGGDFLVIRANRDGCLQPVCPGPVRR